MLIRFGPKILLKISNFDYRDGYETLFLSTFKTSLFKILTPKWMVIIITNTKFSNFSDTFFLNFCTKISTEPTVTVF